MFLLFFLIFTLIFTVFENVLLALGFLLSVLVFLSIFKWIYKRKLLDKKMIFSLVGWFLLAGLAFSVKEYLYYWWMQEGQHLVVWAWMVSDFSSQWKYIFSYENADYLLYSEKNYSIGDHIRIVGNMSSETNAWHWNNLQKYRNISSWTFAVPLFSGSFDYPKRLKMKWWKWTIYETNSLLLRDEGIGTGDKEQIPSSTSQVSHIKIWWIKKMKKWIQEKINKAYGKNRISWLILGMLIGDKSQIPESEYQSFINSWLVHLIAVSGGNILMIVVFLQSILIFIPFYPRLGLILLTIITYGLMCGLDSSVFRAVLMGGISMLALFWGREINIRRLLSISCIAMLVINPYFLAYDTGFLLSYAALLGIVYFDNIQKKEKKKTKNTIKKWWQYVYKTYISPSIWATIGIFPIIIFFMGKINILSIIGNLFVLPIVPFVMIYGCISVWIYGVFHRERLLWIEKFLINYIYKISDLLSEYGVFFSVSGLRFKYLILLIFVMFFMYRKTKKDKI